VIGVRSARKAGWQQATALVSLSTCGAMTGLSLAHGTVADMTSPTGLPVHVLDFSRPAKPAATQGGALRSAVVKVANYYLRMARDKTPAEMEAIIWQSDSMDGIDHGQSCAAFASLTLEMGAQSVGQQSWVTGGGSYPYPLHAWADVRVDPNPASPSVMSIMQQAQAAGRWHPIGDGYLPQPGDWAMFDGHVEVVTKYSRGVLTTIGGDSLPNFSVNAHSYRGSLSAQGITGFVDNGELAAGGGGTSGGAAGSAGSGGSGGSGGGVQVDGDLEPGPGQADVPGLQAAPAVVLSTGDQLTAQRLLAGQQVRAPAGQQVRAPAGQQVRAPAGQQVRAPAGQRARPAAAAAVGLDAADGLGTAAIPGAQVATEDAAAGLRADAPAGLSAQGYHRNMVPPAASVVPHVSAQQTFISQVAPGAIAAQRRYGIPAAVTIAQAIDESGWGQSELATRDHNLFGIKGAGPAGTDVFMTSEYENGQWVTISAGFRVYHNVAESIADHSELLATDTSYQRAMADRDVPDAFANDLTGVYATDPNYGANLIALMRLYNLYQYDSPAPQASPQPVAQASPQPVAQASPQASPRAVAQASPRAVAQQVAPIGVPEPALPGVVALQAGQQAARGGGRAAAGQTGAGQTGAGQTAAHQAVRGGVAGRGGAGQGAAAARGGTAGRRGEAGQGGTARQGGAVVGGGTSIPGDSYPLAAAVMVPAAAVGSARRRSGQSGQTERRSDPRPARITTRRYVPRLPAAVTTAFVTTAKGPLTHAEPLYRDVATQAGIRWELLAACDWMQCEAQPRYSPVHGERLGTRNSDGSVYKTKSDALMQCADELIDLAWAVYHIDLTARGVLSVRGLASVFAAFRWGGLLRTYEISVLEFPYSVAGLTVKHMKMRWPDVDIPDAPDKPGTRFRPPFGAVPVVLSLDYPAIAQYSRHA
jgi:flagellum-specific peptidoglycan hydrolase FlgJ